MLKLLRVSPTSFHWQKTKACTVAHHYKKIFAFPDCFSPPCFGRVFSRITGSLPTKSSSGWFGTEALQSPPPYRSCREDDAPALQPEEMRLSPHHWPVFEWLPPFSSCRPTAEEILLTLEYLLYHTLNISSFSLLTMHYASFLPDALSPHFTPKPFGLNFHSCWCCSFIQQPKEMPTVLQPMSNAKLNTGATWKHSAKLTVPKKHWIHART